MRSKGELILENGMYKLGSNLLRSQVSSHENSKSHKTNTGSSAIYGFAEGSDVSITNKIFNIGSDFDLQGSMYIVSPSLKDLICS